jgi:hypothetical protein
VLSSSSSSSSSLMDRHDEFSPRILWLVLLRALSFPALLLSAPRLWACVASWPRSNPATRRLWQAVLLTLRRQYHHGGRWPAPAADVEPTPQRRLVDRIGAILEESAAVGGGGNEEETTTWQEPPNNAWDRFFWKQIQNA